MRIAALALVGAAALALAGCTPAEDPTGSPTPKATPVFSSDAAALKAAEKAYAAYSRTADLILADGGARPGRIDKVTTGELTDKEHKGSSDFASKGYHSIGVTVVRSMKLESANLKARPGTRAAVATYVCVDVSGVDVIDPTGKSVVPPGRSNTLSYEVTFDLVGRMLLPSRQEPWDSGGVCA